MIFLTSVYVQPFKIEIVRSYFWSLPHYIWEMFLFSSAKSKEMSHIVQPMFQRLSIQIRLMNLRTAVPTDIVSSLIRISKLNSRTKLLIFSPLPVVTSSPKQWLHSIVLYYILFCSQNFSF